MPTNIGKGSRLDEAVSEALANHLDVDVRDVKVSIKASGLAVAGQWEAALTFTPSEVTDRGRKAKDDRDDRGDRDEARSARDNRGDRDDQDDRHDGPDESPVTMDDLDEEADAAADFLEGLLDVLGVSGDIRIAVNEDHAEVELLDVGTGALIGRRGQTLEAIQELVRSSLQRQFQRRARVKVEVEGYRARRLEKLEEKAQEAIDEVLDTGESVRLEPMDVFERKAIHRLVAEVDGVASRSQGREPARRVVIEVE